MSSESKEKSISIEKTFTFQHRIDRVWYVIRDVSLICILKPDVHFPFIVKDGKDSWNVQSEFMGKKDEKEEEFTGKCIEMKNFPQYKKIIWDITTKSGKTLQFQYQLFQVTEDDATILLYKLKFKTKENYLEFKEKTKGSFEKDFKDLMEKINTTLSESSMNLFQYEGGVITGKMEDIWDLITNISKLKKIAPLINLDGDEDTNELPSKPGDISKITYDNKKGYSLAKTLIYDKRKNWNKSVFGFEAFYGEPKIPFQKVIMTLTKINNEECHISLFHDFKECATKEVITNLSSQKKYIIKCIKDYLENYK